MSVFVNYSCLLHNKLHDSSNQSMLNNTMSLVLLLCWTPCLSGHPKWVPSAKGPRNTDYNSCLVGEGLWQCLSHEFMFEKIKRLITKV